MMDRLRPRLIQQFGAGLEGVDVEQAREPLGIPPFDARVVVLGLGEVALAALGIEPAR